jgi:hypothetical protein
MAARVLLVLICCAHPVSAEQPTVKIDTSGRYPQIDIGASRAGCPVGQLGPGTRQAIIDAAALEWAGFDFPRLALTERKSQAVIPDGLSPRIRDTRGSGPAPRLLSVGRMEDDTAVRERIGRYWAALPDEYEGVFAQQNALWARSGGRAGWVQYWSAAFVTYVMCRAGVPPEAFTRSSAHKDYIAAAIAARAGDRPGYAYHAYDLAEAVPRPGDLICAGRAASDERVDSIADFAAKPALAGYHCDIVVGFDTESGRPGLLFAIGGNVLNAVTLTETPLKRGRLEPVRAPYGRNWFAVLRYMGPDGPASFRRVPESVRERAKQLRDSRAAAH